MRFHTEFKNGLAATKVPSASKSQNTIHPTLSEK